MLLCQSNEGNAGADVRFRNLKRRGARLHTAITTVPSSMRSLQILPAVSALLCVCAKLSQALDAGRPNILVIHFDSFAGRDAILDPEQDAIIQPNLQSLIDNGVQFTDTYFASSECVPSRSSCKRLGVVSRGCSFWLNSFVHQFPVYKPQSGPDGTSITFPMGKHVIRYLT